MTTLYQVVGAPLAEDLKWKAIDWKTVEFHVQKLQLRIAKAVGSGRLRKAKALQWLLTHSFYAKLLAVKRITQNKGKKKHSWNRSRYLENFSSKDASCEDSKETRVSISSS